MSNPQWVAGAATNLCSMPLSELKSVTLNRLRWTGKYIADLTKWLLRGHPVIVLLGLILIAALVHFVSSCIEWEIRFFGMLLQLLGVVTVAIGLSDTRNTFNERPTVWGNIKQFWAGRPTYGPRNVVMAAATLSMHVSLNPARARVSSGPNTQLTDRVKLLEQQYASLFDEVGTLSAEAKQKMEELTKAVEAECDNREQGDKTIREQIKNAVAEGIPLQLFGAVLFALGIIAGTASPEIASRCTALLH